MLLIITNSLFSLIIHLIALNNLLINKLQQKQKLVILFLYFINLTVMPQLVGNICAITLLFSINSYFFILKENRIQNISMATMAYILSVLLSNIVTVIFGSLNITSSEIIENVLLLILFSIITTVFVFIGSLLLGKIIKKFTEKKNLDINFWGMAASNIILTAIIFVFNIIVGEYVGYSQEVLIFNCILFGISSIISTIMIIFLLKAHFIKSQLKLKQDSFNNLQEYTSKIEKMYSDIRFFRHDYINIMTSMSGYIEKKDFDGLNKYFSENITPLGNKITQSNDRLNELMNIESLAIKGILSSKFIYANELNIKVNIEILEPVTVDNIDIMDLSRILGIFLDNSIEAALETKNPEISFSMINNQNALAIVIKNNYIKHDIPMHSLNQLNVSSKGSNRGIGLYNVQTILSNYSNILIDTQYSDEFFSQHLEIMG